MFYSGKLLWIVSLYLSTLLSLTNCYTITVDAHAEECFFENVEADTKIGKFYLFLSCQGIVNRYI